ncbi:MAG: mechanosensitive ion channel [Novosphingobium sp.]
MRHLSNAVPAFIIERGIVLVPNIPESAVSVVRGAAAAFIVYTIARAIDDVLDLLNETYEHDPDAARRPIKGYIQLGKIAIYGAAAIIIIAILIGESPILLLSGLGAVAAVLMLIFRDTILSLVASVQLRSNDMLRVGDWITMPQLNADGDVIDIALHTVKVQNFDKTVTAIPTYRLISDSFQNWRGMRESGGRRIKRAIQIDVKTVDFVSEEDWQSFRRFVLLRPYLEEKQAELDKWNAKVAPDEDETVNRRRPTNVGTFRAYTLAYLKAHPEVDQGKTMLVRQLAPGEMGLPLEIYCFTSTTAWAEYERIQADIFDHLLAILPEFGLLLYQHPSGHDFGGLGKLELREVAEAS